ncbi:MAG: hypothetical protein HRU82_05270 [Nitrospira sp.]|nr:MAG: hypothetical protein HRU82_05270 [Nitrospira sp.]
MTEFSDRDLTERTVQYPSEGVTVKAYVVMPRSETPRAATGNHRHTGMVGVERADQGCGSALCA